MEVTCAKPETTASCVVKLYISVTGIDCVEIPSYARGYHAYCHLWTSTIGQVLQLKREPDSCVDKYTVTIVLGRIVGHVPYNLAKCVSQFLSRDANTWN